jgi:hypothetical protein
VRELDDRDGLSSPTAVTARDADSAQGWVLLMAGLLILGCAAALLVWGDDKKGVGEATGLLTCVGAWLCLLGAKALGFKELAERLRIGLG